MYICCDFIRLNDIVACLCSEWYLWCNTSIVHGSNVTAATKRHWAFTAVTLSLWHWRHAAVEDCWTQWQVTHYNFVKPICRLQTRPLISAFLVNDQLAQTWRTTTTVVLWPLYKSTCIIRHLQLRTGGFCWCKVLLPVSPCCRHWLDKVHKKFWCPLKCCISRSFWSRKKVKYGSKAYLLWSPWCGKFCRL